MSWTYQYTERLNGEKVDVTLPSTRQEAKEVWADLSELADKDPVAWKAAFRMWTASDLYVLALACSWAQRKDGWTGRLEIDCDFQFEFSRWVQFKSDDKIDKTARQHWKSTWRHTRIFQEVFRDPNVTIGIFSESKEKAYFHLNRWKVEAEKNPALRMAWDDVLYWRPQEEGAQWSVSKGCSVKRTIASTQPTVSAHTFMTGLPTGARFGILLLDDIETEASVESEDIREKAKNRFRSAGNLGGRAVRKWVVGTHHHPAGLLQDLIDRGWVSHCFPAEDTSKEPPDIAELYDQYNGVRPDSGAEMVPQIRDIKLAGKPTYLHPLECAALRWDQGDEMYETQYLGNPLSGQVHRFKREWIDDDLRIGGDLQEWARGCLGYIVSDPSKGMGDASVGLVVAAKPNRVLGVVDGFRAKLSPEEWARKIYLLSVKWSHIMPIRQIRVEVFGQATWDTVLNSFFARQHYPGPQVYGTGTYRSPGPLGTKLMRAWTRLQPLFRNARLRLPVEIMVEDERGRIYDLIEYFVENEYISFPLPKTDDILDALALLQEPEEKVPPIEYPEADQDEHNLVVGDDGDTLAGIEEESWLWAS